MLFYVEYDQIIWRPLLGGLSGHYDILWFLVVRSEFSGEEGGWGRERAMCGFFRVNTSLHSSVSQ